MKFLSRGIRWVRARWGPWTHRRTGPRNVHDLGGPSFRGSARPEEITGVSSYSNGSGGASTPCRERWGAIQAGPPVRHTQLANRGNPQPDARVGLARLSPVECTLRPSDSCVSIQPTEGHRFYWGGQKGTCLVGGVTEPVRHRRPTWWCDRDRDDDRAHRSSSGCRFAVGGNTTQRSVGGGPHGPLGS